MINNMVMEHPQNLALRQIVESSTMLTYANIANKNKVETLSKDAMVK
jgi:hypothetical protein